MPGGVAAKDNLITHEQEDRRSGDIVVFTAYLASLYAPINTLSQTWGVIQSASVGVQRVFEILDVERDMKDGSRQIAIVCPTGVGKSTLVSLVPRFYDPEMERFLWSPHQGGIRRRSRLSLGLAYHGTFAGAGGGDSLSV